GFDRQFHCHVHVSGSSWAVEEEAAVGCDAGVEACAPEVVPGVAVVAIGAELVPAPVALAGDVTAAATFTCVTGPLSPGLPIRTLTLTLVGAACTAVAPAEAAIVPVVAIPAAVSDETGMVSGSAGAWTGAVSGAGTVSTGAAALGAPVDVASAGATCSVACVASPRASPIAPSTAALASPASTAPVSSDGAVTGADG